MNGRIGLWGAVLLVLSLLCGASAGVVWRQSRALELSRQLEEVRREAAIVEAERVRLILEIQTLESRGRVVSAAADQLGMRVPSVMDLALLPWDGWAGTEAPMLSADAATGSVHGRRGWLDWLRGRSAVGGVAR